MAKAPRFEISGVGRAAIWGGAVLGVDVFERRGGGAVGCSKGL